MKTVNFQRAFFCTRKGGVSGNALATQLEGEMTWVALVPADGFELISLSRDFLFEDALADAPMSDGRISAEFRGFEIKTLRLSTGLDR